MYEKHFDTQKTDLFSSVFKKKNIPDATTPTFQEVGEETSHSYLIVGIRISHGIPLTITQLFDFYSQGILPFLFATDFNRNKPERKFIAKLSLPHGVSLRVICSLF